MNYYKVSIYSDGTVNKEQVTEEETKGYLGAGIYYCGTIGKDDYYHFFIDREDRVQKIYDKYIKSKIREYKKELKRIQNSIKILEARQVLI